jgi:N-acetylglucosamine kinase-like BadF-type ATPase
MTLFAGIDGGQSSTIAVIGDADRRILGRGKAGPADEVAQGPQSTRLHEALNSALQDALANANLPRDARFSAIVAGISGYEGTVYGKEPHLPSDHLTLTHDTVIAHAGALEGKPGIVVIAGTGSVAYGRNENGKHALIGGWGYLFGDEGSAFRIVREALADAMMKQDMGAHSELETPLLRYFEQPSLRALSRAFYVGRISRGDLASAAPIVLQHEDLGGYSAPAAGALVMLAKNAATQLRMGSPHVAFVGGLLQNREFSDRIDLALAQLLPDATRVSPAGDAAHGALLLAYGAP